MTEERRIADRVSPESTDIHVMNRFNNENIGTIANISETGFMLVSKINIDIDSIFQLELQFPHSNIENIHLGVVCLWNSEVGSSEVFWQGFHIIDISDEALSQLKNAVNILST